MPQRKSSEQHAPNDGATQARPFHPAAAMLPMMDKDEYGALVASVKRYGLQKPIKLYADGSILDGRNRYNACLEAGVVPVFEEWSEFDDTDPRVYVVIHNIQRRHLSVGFRARLATRFVTTTHGGDRKSSNDENTDQRRKDAKKPIFSASNDQAPNSALGGKPKRTEADAARICFVSEQRLREVNAVRKNLVEELLVKFEADQITLSSAYFTSKKPPEEQRADPRIKFAGQTRKPKYKPSFDAVEQVVMKDR